MSTLQIEYNQKEGQLLKNTSLDIVFFPIPIPFFLRFKQKNIVNVTQKLTLSSFAHIHVISNFICSVEHKIKYCK